ncbi:hypothetical protein N0V83_000326 [Neocucurbitaria cava]|uniref:Uncharacterized protein n=1 Tax=Neocucurbitaria cava TaxID=798079 RepID=A0A9W8YHL3_9PLEO|nr:hypothetical protein N0V83_000326 [Neocucurbitaria cava]
MAVVGGDIEAPSVRTDSIRHPRRSVDGFEAGLHDDELETDAALEEAVEDDNEGDETTAEEDDTADEDCETDEPEVAVETDGLVELDEMTELDETTELETAELDTAELETILELEAAVVIGDEDGDSRLVLLMDATGTLEEDCDVLCDAAPVDEDTWEVDDEVEDGTWLVEDRIVELDDDARVLKRAREELEDSDDDTGRAEDDTASPLHFPNPCWHPSPQ